MFLIELLSSDFTASESLRLELTLDQKPFAFLSSSLQPEYSSVQRKPKIVVVQALRAERAVEEAAAVL